MGPGILSKAGFQISAPGPLPITFVWPDRNVWWPIPRDWALTPDGEETDDPHAAMAGALLGIGQYKGYGLAFMTDVLTGVIGGGESGSLVAPTAPGSYAFFCALHPSMTGTLTVG